ncbi:tyrosine-type recombinase/integrase [[Mycobacterium] holstebronense]|uniref:Tyrosine-type recombinase/integrase n=1 Tax=[Mycobacterium] holstebronense TaxID=3064288 RepID=A0ABN9NGE0_9MYCO|nr:tyrosine-type recombinase/integrase [Mycolicibacter sp. MU0102]CAJ1504198.1 tyrosine-type recombinase/integrase [Mycolicibacter sp. MU0102]
MTTSTATNRARMVRQRSRRLGLRMVQRGTAITLYGAEGEITAKGDLATIEAYLAAHAQHRASGPAPARTPVAWQEAITAYCTHLAAAGQSIRTVAARRKALARLGRELGCAPADVTAETLVGWFGRQTWKPETRRFYRAAAHGFLAWGHQTGRVAVDLGDAVPAVRIPPSVPKPVPDGAWRTALAAVGPRERLMLRLAAEVGLRRLEVAQVRVSDLEDTHIGPALRVLGKGGRTRVVPISDDLATAIRRGAGGHTPELAAFGAGDGYLFPGQEDGHLSAQHVGKLVTAALPAGLSMHKLRHRFATRAFRHGGRNLLAVQRLLGHSSVATTQRYTAVDDDELRAAALAAIDATGQ